MPETDTISSGTKVRNRRVHMANERTFLAWIRTSISVMAFGFVVERFALFVKQLSSFLGRETTPPSSEYTTAMGILLVGLGALMGVLAFFRYKSVQRQIDNDTYVPSLLLDVLLVLAVLAVGVFLMLYLAHRR
jgi:putative membrane protein